MNELDCENVMMAIMAEADGESQVAAEARQHFEQCERCRAEFAGLTSLNLLFDHRTRLGHEVDQWPVIEQRISAVQRRRIDWLPFALVAVLLAGYKLHEMLAASDPGHGFKLVPIAIVFTLFLLIKENPFRINTGLDMGEIKI